MSTDLEKRVALAITGSGVTSKASLRMAKAAIDVVVEECAAYLESVHHKSTAEMLRRALAPKEKP